MKSFLLLVAVVFIVLFSSNVFGLSTIMIDSVKVSKSSPTHESNASSSVQPGHDRMGYLSIGEMKVLLIGGRQYDFRKRRWSYFEPTGLYRENLLLSFVRHRERVRSVYPFGLGTELVSKE